MPESGERYVPALRFRSLTRLYDPVVRTTTREREFKSRLLRQTSLAPGQRVLDLGCGTGTLAIEAKLAQPRAEIVGLDDDPEVLERARSKAKNAGVEVSFDEGLSTELPYGDDSIDVVMATLFFHHLTRVDKLATAGEIARVLAPGGALHVADFGRPTDPVMAALFWQIRLFDGLEQTRDNGAGALPAIFEQGGLHGAEETDRLRTILGTLALYRASAPVSNDANG
jgi:ubiquinone/menaquinone biosynthesis C-methylase UbiE